MTTTNPGSTDAVITCLLAGQLNDTHLGKHIAFYSGGKRQFGVLESIYRPKQGVRTLGLSSGRHRDVTATTEVDVITQESTA